MSEDAAPTPYVESRVGLGETDSWIAASHQHLTGEPWPGALSMAAMIGAILVAITAAGLIGHPAGWAAAAIVGIVAFRARPWLRRTLTLRNVNRALAIRGVHHPMSASMTVTDTEVLWTLGVFDSRCPVSAVSDVRRLGPYWVMTVEGSSALLPDRAFASDEHRRTVLSALRLGMTPEAVARSPDLKAALAA